jgi:hypothetical protein
VAANSLCQWRFAWLACESAGFADS